MLIGEYLNCRSLYLIVTIVLCLSVWRGYWSAFFPYRAIILRDLGYTAAEVGQMIFVEGIFLTAVGIGGSILLLLISYYSGKGYKLTGTSTLLLLIILIISIFVGSLIGYIIRQAEYPQYPILNITFFFDIFGTMQSRIVWTFLGIFAGNYKREIETKQRPRR